MPIGTTSYFERSMDLRIDSADRSETSCSPERPPKITPTRIFFMASTLLAQRQRLCRFGYRRHQDESPCAPFLHRPVRPIRFVSRALEGSLAQTIPTSSNQK